MLDYRDRIDRIAQYQRNQKQMIHRTTLHVSLWIKFYSTYVARKDLGSLSNVFR